MRTYKGWPSGEIVEQAQKRHHLFSRWYRLTAPPEPPATANFVQREAARQAHLLSTVVFFLILTLLILLPATLFLRNHFVIIAMLTLLGTCAIALQLNRTGKTLLAGTIIVASSEVALMTVIATNTPLDVDNLPLLDMFIATELLATSLLPTGAVFFVALLNILFTVVALRYLPQTSPLMVLLKIGFYNTVVQPISLQLFVAVVAYLWSHNTTQAIHRADRAEMIASLEHKLAEQKHELETGIQKIMQTHISVANGDLNARAPLTQGNVLWHVANSLNMLLARFQRASLAQQELERLRNAIATATTALQKVNRKRPLQPLPPTKTAIDPLLVSFHALMLSDTKHGSDTPPPASSNCIFCPSCGTDLNQFSSTIFSSALSAVDSVLRCPSCKRNVGPEETYCGRCGATLDPATVQSQNANTHISQEG